MLIRYLCVDVYALIVVYSEMQHIFINLNFFKLSFSYIFTFMYNSYIFFTGFFYNYNSNYSLNMPGLPIIKSTKMLHDRLRCIVKNLVHYSIKMYQKLSQ